MWSKKKKQRKKKCKAAVNFAELRSSWPSFKLDRGVFACPASQWAVWYLFDLCSRLLADFLKLDVARGVTSSMLQLFIAAGYLGNDTCFQFHSYSSGSFYFIVLRHVPQRHSLGLALTPAGTVIISALWLHMCCWHLKHHWCPTGHCYYRQYN